MIKAPNCAFVLMWGLVAALGVAPVMAGSPETNLLLEETIAKVPSEWQVHISPRGNTLVIFLTPPYQEAFNFWYDPQRLQEKMLALCPGPNDEIWAKIPLNQTIAIQPTVGGKSTEAMRLICKRGASPPA